MKHGLLWNDYTFAFKSFDVLIPPRSNREVWSVKRAAGLLVIFLQHFFDTIFFIEKYEEPENG